MGQRSIVQWNQWLNKSLGQLILKTERELLETFLSGMYGKHVVLIGVPHQTGLIKTLDLPCHTLLSPLSYHHRGEIKAIESNLLELPLISGSVDVVILPHTLEFVDNPRQLLAEACRIVKPEGHLLICGFNLYSLWGLSRMIHRRKSPLPAVHSVQQGTLKNWLNLSDFELVKQANALYSPPLENTRVMKKLRFLEWLGNKCRFPGGAIFVLMARAKVVPLTPVRLRWKQSIAGMRIPSGIPGPTARNAK